MRHLLRGLALLLVLALPAAAQDPYFEIDQLNPGLGAPPDDIDQRTSHGAMASFVDAVEREEYDSAAHVLNMADFPPETQAERGPSLAKKLGLLLDRKVIIPWDDLLERPDNLYAETSDRTSTAGEERRSLLIAKIDNGRRNTAIRLNRVKPEGGDPVWVFSRETVAQIDSLYDLHGPTALESALPEPWRKEVVYGLAGWELVALPLLILSAFLAGLMGYRGFRHLSKWANGTVASIVLDALRWPSVIALVTTVVMISTNWILVFSGAISAVLQPMVVIGYVVAILIFGLRLIDTAMSQFITFDMGELAGHDRGAMRSLATSMAAGRRALIVIAVAISGGIILTSAQIFGTLGLSLLASAGALTLVLGFAARRVLGNIMASLQIALNRSARIGDQVDYEGRWCTVERIHFTYVQLKTWDGNRLIVPVEHFVSDSFENFTLDDSEQTRWVKITFAQTADLEAIRERFHAILQQVDGVVDPEEGLMLVVSQDAFGQVVRFQFPTPNPDIGWITECTIREELMKAAQELDEGAERPVLPRGSMDDMAA